MGKIIDLRSKKCVPCEGGTLPLTQKEASILLAQVPTWKLSDDTKSISHEYKFKDFLEAMEMVRRVADLAESEGHHPDIFISYNKIRLALSTHAIGGLSENDFVLAAKIDQLA